MKNLRNKNAPPPETAIQTFLSSSWDKVLAVYGKLAEIELVADSINGGGFDNILTAADIDTLAELNAIVLDATLGDSADFATAAQGAKVDLLTVTAATDLDAIRTRVNDLDAAVILRGEWSALVGTFPGGGTAQAGDSYIVSQAGTVDGVDFFANDRIVALVDNASTATYAGNWLKLDYTDQVLAVAGLVGNILAADLRTAINVEDGATADQTGAEIKALYEAELDTNALTDALLSKLNGIEAGAQVNRALASQAEAEAGTDNVKGMTPLRVAQAIAALASGGITWNIQGDAGFNALADNGYVVDGLTADRTATLPAAPNVGDTLIIWNNDGTGGFPWDVQIAAGGSNEITERNVTVISTVNLKPGDMATLVCYDAGATKKWYMHSARTANALSAGGGGGLTPQFDTANRTVANGELCYIDSNGGAFTLTLPAGPSSGHRVLFIDTTGHCESNPVTIARNGQTINGVAADFDLDQSFGWIDMAFNGTTWVHGLQGTPNTLDGGTGGLTVVPVKVANYSANLGELIPVNPYNGSFTITLPATPLDNDRVQVVDVGHNCRDFPVTIDGNGNTVDGGNTFLLDQNNGQVDMYYDGAGDWKVALTGTPDLVNVVDNIAGAETIFLQMGNHCTIPTASPATEALEGDTNSYLDVVRFSPSLYEKAWHLLRLPKRWDGNDIRFRVYWAPGSTDTGDVQVGLYGNWLSDGSAWPSSDPNVGATINDTAQGTIDMVHVSPWSGKFNFAGTPGDSAVAIIKIQRNGGGAPDTFTGELHMIAVEFEYITDAVNDA